MSDQRVHIPSSALHRISPGLLDEAERRDGEALWKAWWPRVAESRHDLVPFHWQLEFPAVFYDAEGSLKPVESRGFDAVLGNPPYISTHTSKEESWRPVLERRMGYLEDLYVHFTDLGFKQLRPGGTFGFIVSDTFFTLNTKERMREWLQSNRLTHLGQCDPFNATVERRDIRSSKGPRRQRRPVALCPGQEEQG